MRAHATQISVEDGFFALSNNLGSRALGVEFYRLVRGQVAGELDADGRETDLFAGRVAPSRCAEQGCPAVTLRRG